MYVQKFSLKFSTENVWYIYCTFINSLFYLTRFNPKRKGLFKFCLPALLEIHDQRNPKQKHFLTSSKVFLRIVLFNRAWPSKLLSEKLPEWHFLTLSGIISKILILFRVPMNTMLDSKIRKSPFF